LLQQEAGSHPPYNRPALPMDVCGAMSQGQIGYLIQKALGTILVTDGPDSRLAKKPGDKIKCCTFVTHVVISKDDPAFKNPTKPVGPFYTKEQVDELRKKHSDYVFLEDAGRGYRRFVPSPLPVEIYEREQINTIIETGIIPIVSGGGGIPVIKTTKGTIEGITGVIDKDLAACQLAFDTGAEVLTILTDPEQVMLNFNTPQAKGISKMTLADLEENLAKGAFGNSLKGSMGPKLDAARRFLKNGGKKVVITRPDLAADALDGKVGTTFVP